jgi:D-alanyl-D-alanine carboxypeptidase
MPKTQNLLKHLPLVASLAIFVFVVVLLVSTPRVVTLAESKISAGEEIPQPIAVIEGEVAGESKQPSIRVESAQIATPSVTAYGVYAIDMDLGEELLAKNSQSRLSMASTTKIMTALVAADYFKSGQVLTVPKEALVGGSSMGLFAGEQMTFRSLLYGKF